MTQRVPEQWNRSEETAQIAVNHLKLQIQPHIAKRCDCRSEEACKKSLARNVRFAISVLRTYTGERR